MLSAIRRLFGSRDGPSARTGEAEADAVDYKGFRIIPQPLRQNGAFLTAGLIVRESPEGGGRREHRFVRADTHPSADDAREFTILKAQRLIDEQGERLFGP